MGGNDAMRPIKYTGTMPAFVFVDERWESFDEFIVFDWEIFAAAAWLGFRDAGKGAVIVDSGMFMLAYVPADASASTEARNSLPLVTEARDGLLRELLGHCQRYRQERDIVLLLRGASSANAARGGRTTVCAGVILTPRGWLTPPAAYKAFQAEAGGETGFQGLRQRWEAQRRRFREGGVTSSPAT